MIKADPEEYYTSRGALTEMGPVKKATANGAFAVVFAYNRNGAFAYNSNGAFVI